MTAAPLMDFSLTQDDVASPTWSAVAVLPAPPAAAASADAVAAPSDRGPPTARLIALGGPSRRPLMAPDLCQLFALYYPVDLTAVKAPPPAPAPNAS